MRIEYKFGNLPVAAVAEEVIESLAIHQRLLVTAPPGAGKSTLLPLLLLDHFPAGKIIMLEPRRIATRQVAERMAGMLGEKPGQTVGYRMRFESRVSSSTRIEVVTEGIMERILINDPTLDGVGIVIFDEYHERSLSSDLSMALVREIQNVVRPDLRILVMSATIDTDALIKSIDSFHIHTPGKSHDVKIIHGKDYDMRDCALTVARAVSNAMLKHDGTILAFLPGMAEILKCQDILAENLSDVEIIPVYGMLPPDQQRKVFSIPENSKRRIILASPIAETSLTIEGVTVVVDSGLYRTPLYDPATGLSRLVTMPVSLDMAAQRTGRAGRLGPGYCYRLWSKATEAKMKECRQPEILSADLTPMILSLRVWGEKKPLRLPWVTLPPEGHLNEGMRLLTLLGCINEEGELTPKGYRLAALPCHPRIASMLADAQDLGGLACDIAAILEEKDPLNNEKDADLSLRVDMLCKGRKTRLSSGWKRIEEVSAQYRRLLKCAPYSGGADPEDIGKLIAMAYPERVAMRTGDGRYRLAAGGETIGLQPDDDLARNEFLAIASMGKQIFLAAPLSREFIEGRGKWKECAMWNSSEGKAVVREELQFGALTLAVRGAKGNITDTVVSVIASAARKEGLTMFDFNKDVENLQLRIAIASSWHPEIGLPDVSTEEIISRVDEWLPLYIGKATSTQELRKIDMRRVILGLLDYGQQIALSDIAPEQIKLPSGRLARVRYRRGAEAPVVSVKLQDCFGLLKTPCVDKGKRPVLMELLSPGFKPVQLTMDMAGFWENTYFEVRKELRRRYPKHKWPENPLLPG